MKIVKVLILVIYLGILAACGGGGGGGGAAKPGTAGVFTLKVSGGTLNDGSASNGLVVLATLRDGNGAGPGLNSGWRITITGPGIAQPLTVSYSDGSPSSYQIWRWPGLLPSAGTYTVTASNGSATLTSSFPINSSDILQQVPLTRNNNTISWSAVAGAASYYYKVSDGAGGTVVSGYLNGAPSLTAYSFQLPTLADGSYRIEVSAHTNSLPQLMADPSPAPSLPPQGNISVSAMDLVVAAGVGGSYNLTAKGGILYMGKDGAGVDRYGLAVWSSILTSTATAPAGDWTINVTGPGITAPLTFIYPRTNSHYLYWDFATPPAAGSYSVTATSPGYALTAGFAIPDQSARIPVAANITVTPATGNYSVSWSAVPGALSYYVNLWTTVGGVYTEIAGEWVNSPAASILSGSLTKGQQYDVYVTSSTLDMTTSKTLPPPSPAQVNMSDNTYGALPFTAQ